MKTIYTQNNCPACIKLKREYTDKKIPFKEIHIGVDISVSEFKTLFPNVRSVPFVTEE